MFFRRVFKELDRRKVRYLVIGGVAVNLYGAERATGDLDILLSLDSQNIQKFIQMVKRLGWKPRVPVELQDFAVLQKRREWIKRKGMKVFSVFNPKDPLEHVDVVTEDYIGFEKAYKRRNVVKAAGIKILVASVDDLIKLKKIAGRTLDKMDIERLKEIRRIENAKKKGSSWV